nr:MAG TPA: hypothetical protein [Caudoviricetes sp.]
MIKTEIYIHCFCKANWISLIIFLNSLTDLISNIFNLQG